MANRPHNCPTTFQSLACALSAIVAAGLAGCGDDNGGDTQPIADAQISVVENVPGTFNYTVEVSGETREYIVYVPALAAGSVKAPLVVMVHGTAQSGQDFYDKAVGWVSKADEVGAIIAFPTALTYCHYEDVNNDGVISGDNERKLNTKWTMDLLSSENGPIGLELCTASDIAALPAAKRTLADHPAVDDVVFIDTMLESIASNHVVDPKRYYVTGFSNGAGFTQRLLTERSDVFAAFGVNAHKMVVAPNPDSRPASVLFAIGNSDPVILGPAVPVPLNENVATFPEFRDRYISPILTTTQLESSYVFSELSREGISLVRWLYETSLVGASNRLEFYLIENLGHKYPDYMPTVLWDFFENETLP